MLFIVLSWASVMTFQISVEVLFGNRSGFTVMPHYKVNLSRNVSLQKMTL